MSEAAGMLAARGNDSDSMITTHWGLRDLGHIASCRKGIQFLGGSVRNADLPRTTRNAREIVGPQ